MYGHKIDHSILLVILISFISVDVLPLTVSLLLFICTFSFFLDWSCYRFVHFIGVLESIVHFLPPLFFVFFFNLYLAFIIFFFLISFQFALLFLQLLELVIVFPALQSVFGPKQGLRNICKHSSTPLWGWPREGDSLKKKKNKAITAKIHK